MAAAVVVHALLATVLLIPVAVATAGGEPTFTLLGLVALLPGSVALGLWQGNRGARFTAILFGVPSIVVSIAMVLLLVVPESSRTWFTREELGGDEFLDEDDEEQGDDPAAGRRVTP